MRLLFAIALLFAVPLATAQDYTFDGVLEDGDERRGSDEFYDEYTVDLEAGRRVTVRMESSDFDTYLIVRSPSGVESYNDDFDGTSVSQLELLVSEEGTWTIWASAYSSSHTGAYKVDVTLGEKVDVEFGELDELDMVRADGQYYEQYVLDLEAGRMVTVRMESSDFDTYLVLRSPSGRELENDDYDGISVSQIETWATESGPWVVLATSYGSGATGSYAYSVELGGQADIQTIEGRLDYSDERALKGEYFDTHFIDAPAAAKMTFELHSMGYTGYLVVTGPDGEIHRYEGAEDGLSQIGPLIGAGEWRIDVTSNSPGEQGAYDLRIITLPIVE